MICILGPLVMLGYLNDTQITASALQTSAGKTWYLSGDKGYLDEDNFLHIEDRYSRFAKIGGEMISLGFVETSIRRVSDDIELELVAISVPHSKKGESIIILSNRELQQQELRKHLLDAGLGSLALPSAYFLVDEIPKLGSGKTDFGSAKKLALRLGEIGDKYGKAKDQ